MAINPTILIIDDDTDLVDAMRLVLESESYQVKAAPNSKVGYALIQAQPPDLIILDVMMVTETEGFDLAYKLRNQAAYKDIPILMITSFLQKMAREGPEKFQHILGESWPVTQLLEKPVDPEELLSTVAEILQGKV
jgi:two-component system alkaline phosphatase synthesis response regulator PhoP